MTNNTAAQMLVNIRGEDGMLVTFDPQGGLQSSYAPLDGHGGGAMGGRMDCVFTAGKDSKCLSRCCKQETSSLFLLPGIPLPSSSFACTCRLKWGEG